MNTINDRLEEFFSKFNDKRFYKKKEVIIRADDNPPGVFYLKEGYARLYTISPNGQELTLNILKPGGYFSMMWAIGDTQNTYYFEALTKLELWRSPKEELINFIREEPEVLFEFTRRILIGLDGLLGVIESLLFGNSYNKVATALLTSAKRFGKKQANGEIVIELPLTHHLIASLAGLTRETTSLVMKEFEVGGILSPDRPFITVRNMEKLEKETLISKDQPSLPHVV